MAKTSLDLEMSRNLNNSAPLIEGQLVRLKQLDISQLEPYLEFLADPEGQRLTATTQKFTRDKIIEWLTTRPSATGRFDWSIHDVDTDAFLGEVVLNEFDQAKNAMKIRIALAHPSVYGRGLGTEAMQLAVAHAFGPLEIARLNLEVLVENTRAQRVYEKVGFVAKRQFTEGKHRFQRMSATRLDYIRSWAEREMAKHIDLSVWRLEFDNAKTRAGVCKHDPKVIGLSRLFIEVSTDEVIMQTVLHEIAHAMNGAKVGHGKKWRDTATSIGYQHKPLDGREIGERNASWIGHCLQGHDFYRFKRPTDVRICAACHNSGQRDAVIRWLHRDEFEDAQAEGEAGESDELEQPKLF